MVRPFSLVLACAAVLSYCSSALAGPLTTSNSQRSTKGRLSFNRAACQALTKDPLHGCPKGTLLVGATGKYPTIQSAVQSLKNDSSTAVILVLAGNYTEQVNVTRSGPVYLLGQTSHPKDYTYNLVNVIWAAIAGTGDNAYTATLTVAPNLDAALTGSGTTGHTVPANESFGNVDFRTYNLNFINDYAPYSDGPSLALSMGYANAGFYYSGFYSYQDTLYVGKVGSAYFYKSAIAGQTDFFYGFGTLWAQSCDVQLRSCGGGIIAWKGTNTTYANKYGAYIVESNIHKANSSLNITHKCALGRPWNAQMRSIFALNYMDDSILPTGYIDWVPSRANNYTFMAEYRDYGPGFNLTARLTYPNLTKEISTQVWEQYDSPAKVFQYYLPGAYGPAGPFGNDKWVDYDP